MKVVVTGVSGYLGRYCVDDLLSAGHAVTGITRDPDVTDRMLGGRIPLQHADLLDRQQLRGALRAVMPDAVLHLAGETGRGPDADLRALWMTNVQATHDLMSVLPDSVERVLIGSSAAVYGRAGEGKRCSNESLPLKPVSLYGVTKAAQEWTAALAGQERGVGVSSARIFNLIGPDGPPGTVALDLAERLVRDFRKGKPLAVETVQSTRDFVDVRDAAAVLTALLPSAGDAEAWNVCTGIGTTVEELAEWISRELRQPLRFQGLDPQGGDLLEQVGDPSALRAALGWGPGSRVQETVVELVRTCLEDLDVVTESR